MGCITGMVAKLFLTAFNVAVALTGVGVLTLAALTTSKLQAYKTQVPDEIFSVLAGFDTVSVMVICLGVLGVLVACCCHNKLFLYTYFLVGAAMVIITLVFAGIGMANINNDKYENDIKTLMTNDLNNYYGNSTVENRETLNNIYNENSCCGVESYMDWVNKFKPLPPGCCFDYDIHPNAKCGPAFPASSYHTNGCFKQLITDVGELAPAAAQLAVFFGVLLFALLTSTCLCVKCTDAMPI